jgi:hypothetical protein
VSPDYKDAFIVDEAIVKEKSLEKEKIKKTITGGVDVKRYHIPRTSKRLIYTSSKDLPKDIPNIIEYLSAFKSKITCKEVKEGKHPFYALHRAREENIFLKKEKIIGVITADKIITALDESNLYPTDGLYLFSSNEHADPRFLIAVLNSKIATYVYRLFSFEEGRALAQVKPSILKDIPVPRVNWERQQPFVKMVAYIQTLLQQSDERYIHHTSNERIAAHFDEVLNMMVFEIYLADHFAKNELGVLQFIEQELSKTGNTQKDIVDFYLWLQQPENPVRNRIISAGIKSPDIIARINAFSIEVT